MCLSYPHADCDASRRGPVTSVEWSPFESSVLTTTSGDGQLAVWDLALERDPEEEAALVASMNAASPDDLPAQLLFVHLGQVCSTPPVQFHRRSVQSHEHLGHMCPIPPLFSFLQRSVHCHKLKLLTAVCSCTRCPFLQGWGLWGPSGKA